MRIDEITEITKELNIPDKRNDLIQKFKERSQSNINIHENSIVSNTIVEASNGSQKQLSSHEYQMQVNKLKAKNTKLQSELKAAQLIRQTNNEKVEALELKIKKYKKMMSELQLKNDRYSNELKFLIHKFEPRLKLENVKEEGRLSDNNKVTQYPKSNTDLERTMDIADTTLEIFKDIEHNILQEFFDKRNVVREDKAIQTEPLPDTVTSTKIPSIEMVSVETQTVVTLPEKIITPFSALYKKNKESNKDKELSQFINIIKEKNELLPLKNKDLISIPLYHEDKDKNYLNKHKNYHSFSKSRSSSFMEHQDAMPSNKSMDSDINRKTKNTSSSPTTVNIPSLPLKKNDGENILDVLNTDKPLNTQTKNTNDNENISSPIKPEIASTNIVKPIVETNNKDQNNVASSNEKTIEHITDMNNSENKGKTVIDSNINVYIETEKKVPDSNDDDNNHHQHPKEKAPPPNTVVDKALNIPTEIVLRPTVTDGNTPNNRTTNVENQDKIDMTASSSSPSTTTTTKMKTTTTMNTTTMTTTTFTTTTTTTTTQVNKEEFIENKCKKRKIENENVKKEGVVVEENVQAINITKNKKEETETFNRFSNISNGVVEITSSAGDTNSNNQNSISHDKPVVSLKNNIDSDSGRGDVKYLSPKSGDVADGNDFGIISDTVKVAQSKYRNMHSDAKTLVIDSNYSTSMNVSNSHNKSGHNRKRSSDTFLLKYDRPSYKRSRSSLYEYDSSGNLLKKEFMNYYSEPLSFRDSDTAKFPSNDNNKNVKEINTINNNDNKSINNNN
ncbi:hypothetical protein PIROE2DRAFT_61944 [Piromyces sp. E2]|nr:hypothetical protein PIROE2DRAFT_61944 [Piromyces sp. E2]|eukprot:OUM62354.1 hypothetical protein PIROE2DRAFT_61944 [Piromyces sp. E2]